MMIEHTFFELIQVALGIRVCLSRTPLKTEWEILYSMAKKQCLVGVCFVGVQKLQKQMQEPPQSLYLTWMGMTAKIQQRNEVMNRRCIELQTKLSSEGFKSCILKGQGIANLYGSLSEVRQSGDIDVLLWKDGLRRKENRKAVIELARSIDKEATGAEHHVNVHFFKDTEVELHYEPSYFCNPWANMRFRKWCELHKKDMMTCEALGCIVPNAEYNVVFLMSHAFRHYVSEGVGLRQVMDYYFVLRNAYTMGLSSNNVSELHAVFKSLNMLKFASAMMWVIGYVFEANNYLRPAFDNDTINPSNTAPWMICEPDERLGRILLAHIMRGGNFGHHNTEKVASKTSHFGRFVSQLTSDLRLSTEYPCEALWSPISMIREFMRIRI